MQILKFEHAIMVLAGVMLESDSENPNLNFPKEAAQQYLCDFSGIDLGFDAAAWRDWFNQNILTADDLLRLQIEYYERIDSRKTNTAVDD